MNQNERLKNARKVLGMSQDEFAEKLGVKRAIISLMENNQRTITKRFLSYLKTYLNVNPDYISQGEEPMFLSRKITEAPEPININTMMEVFKELHDVIEKQIVVNKQIEKNLTTIIKVINEKK